MGPAREGRREPSRPRLTARKRTRHPTDLRAFVPPRRGITRRLLLMVPWTLVQSPSASPFPTASREWPLGALHRGPVAGAAPYSSPGSAGWHDSALGRGALTCSDRDKTASVLSSVYSGRSQVGQPRPIVDAASRRPRSRPRLGIELDVPTIHFLTRVDGPLRPLSCRSSWPRDRRPSWGMFIAMERKAGVRKEPVRGSPGRCSCPARHIAARRVGPQVAGHFSGIPTSRSSSPIIHQLRPRPPVDRAGLRAISRAHLLASSSEEGHVSRNRRLFMRQSASDRVRVHDTRLSPGPRERVQDHPHLLEAHRGLLEPDSQQRRLEFGVRGGGVCVVGGLSTSLIRVTWNARRAE